MVINKKRCEKMIYSEQELFIPKARGRPMQLCTCNHPKSYHDYRNANLVRRCKVPKCICEHYVKKK